MLPYLLKIISVSNYYILVDLNRNSAIGVSVFVVWSL